MTDQRRRRGPGGVDQPGYVSGQPCQRIVLAFLRTARAAIAALIDSPHKVAEAGKKRDLIVPAHGMQRKSMQQQGQPVAFACLEDLEFEPISRNHAAMRAQQSFQRSTHVSISLPLFVLDLRFQALPDEIIACHSSFGGESTSSITPAER